ncbi:hypothetical protein [Xanthomonas arboricola]|uniref:hypothetical protein n=1 Tax=Xanthomonas arboricola TaxID=56448 RepID=UPI0004D8733E|nr:hypothetical protein [Xanthomonas arboricola]KER84248.1 hypothetical protein IA64_07485 [Xanthomonas arboricola pv. celebensis]MBB3849425.1 hypothetical protein [Xanthomonas arboricola]PPT21886.1 hypothetical protein XarbCFBP7629_10080 [Xanthomonas arboricola]PPT51977.1 hypothetical protein XarjCFBP7652_00275 [Xanthomonas arboricola]CAD7382798.1 hypothetical protein X12_002704 [Xanthomonas arboricola]
MRQQAMPLPSTVPLCQSGHRPQMVTTHGAPHRYRLGGPAPTTFHIECCRCGKATAPSTSRALTESRWTEPTGQHRIPLSHLSRAREQLFAQLARTAHPA